MASNYSIYAPPGAAPLTPYNVETLRELREGDGGQPFLLDADPSVVMGVLAEEGALGTYGDPEEAGKTWAEDWAEPWAEPQASPRQEVANTKGPWMKRWIVLFGAWVGLLLNGFIFNSATLLMPYIDGHTGKAGSGVLCITMLNTAW